MNFNILTDKPLKIAKRVNWLKMGSVFAAFNSFDLIDLVLALFCLS